MSKEDKDNQSGRFANFWGATAQRVSRDEALALEGLGVELDDDEEFLWRDASDSSDDWMPRAAASLPRRAALIERFKELWSALRSSLAARNLDPYTAERFSDAQWRELADAALFAEALNLDPLELGLDAKPDAMISAAAKSAESPKRTPSSRSTKAAGKPNGGQA